jgi:hypothetical protein
MRLSCRPEPFDSTEYLFELKIDGFRALANSQDRQLWRSACRGSNPCVPVRLIEIRLISIASLSVLAFPTFGFLCLVLTQALHEFADSGSRAFLLFAGNNTSCRIDGKSAMRDFVTEENQRIRKMAL